MIYKGPDTVLCWRFVIQSVKHQLFPCTQWLGLKWYGCSVWADLHHIQFHPDQLSKNTTNQTRTNQPRNKTKWKTKRFCFLLTVTLNHGQGHWSWYKMVVTKWRSVVPISMAGTEESGWKICKFCPRLKLFKYTTDRWTNMTDYTNPCYPHSSRVCHIYVTCGLSNSMN